MIKKKASPPATKKDVEKAVNASHTGLQAAMQTMKQEIFHYFDLKTEVLMHDYRDAFNDRTSQHSDQIQNHEQRLRRVEKNIGLVA